MQKPYKPALSVLIVHRYFWPENISETPSLLRTVAEHHLARGDRVRVVTGASEDFVDRWTDAFAGKVSVRAFRAPVDRGCGMPRRVANSLRLLRLAAAEMVREPTDLLYVLSYPPLVGGLLVAVGRMTRRARSAIYIVQDLFTYRIDNPILRSAYIGFSGLTLCLAARTMTLSNAMKRQLLTHIRPDKQESISRRIAVIPNFSSELEEAMPPPASKTYDIIYAGAHGRPQNLALFVAAMGLLQPEDRPRAVFYGRGDARTALIGQAETLGLGSALEFRDPVSREEIAAEIVRARFGLVGALADLMDYAFPSKLANYAALGVPSLVMCPDRSETAAWLDQTGLGLALDPASPKRAAGQLKEYFAAAAQSFDRTAVREAARKQFSKESYLTALDGLLTGLEVTARK